jgi:hypothetical protein
MALSRAHGGSHFRDDLDHRAVVFAGVAGRDCLNSVEPEWSDYQRGVIGRDGI